MKERLRGSVLVALLLALVVMAAACSSDEGDTSDTEGTPEGSISSAEAPAGETETGPTTDATLADFTITLASSELAAGEVTFNVTNTGPSEHELVVVKTDLAPDALPTGSDGSVDEEGDGIEAIGEVEDVANGASATLSLTLEPGSYVALCNLPGHYAAGMATAFTVK